MVDHRGPTAASGGPARRDGEPLPGLSEMTALLPADASTCTVLFKVAAGPWHTDPDLGEESGRSSARGTVRAYIFGDAIATKKGTTLSVTHNIQDKPVRLVAVDVDGKEHRGEDPVGQRCEGLPADRGRVRPAPRANQGIPSSRPGPSKGLRSRVSLSNANDPRWGVTELESDHPRRPYL